MDSKNERPAKPIRMVIADVDGTLVTQEKVLTKRAAEAVLQLQQAGIQFSVTSGRPPRGMAMLIDPLKLTQPLAAFQWGRVDRARSYNGGSARKSDRGD